MYCLVSEGEGRLQNYTDGDLYAKVLLNLKIVKTYKLHGNKFCDLDLPNVPDERAIFHSVCHRDFNRINAYYKHKYQELHRDYASPVRMVEENGLSKMDIDISSDDEESYLDFEEESSGEELIMINNRSNRLE